MRIPLVALCLALAACGDDGTGEAIVPVTLAFVAEGADQPLVTRTGWTVELEEARIAVGPVHLFTRPPATASLPARLRALVLPTAHAHAGFGDHDEGPVRLELLEPVLVDLLAAAPLERELEAVSGAARSGLVEFGGVDEPSLHGAQAWVRGVATRGDETIRFAGGLQLPADAKSRRVAGIPAAVELAAGSRVTLVVHPETWFADADFSSLPEPEPEPGAEGVRPITTNSQVHTAWYLGARSWRAFSIH